MARRRTFGYVRKMKSGRWQASYLDPVSRSRVKAPSTFDTKSDASRWIATAETDLARGVRVDAELAERPFDAWAAEWLGGLHVKPKTFVGYEASLRNHVLPAFGQRPVNSITYRHCKAFVDDLLRSGLAPGTAGEARKVLRLVLREALRNDAITRNPADGIRIPRGDRQEMQFLSPDQINRLAHEISNPPRPRSQPLRTYPTYSLLVRVAAWSGLRAGEIGALRVGRIDLPSGRLEVAESVSEIHGELVYGSPKTYSRRRVALPGPLFEELLRHLDTIDDGDPDRLVFGSPSGGPLRHNNFLRRHYKPAVARAGIDPRTRFHDLRHTAAALMIGEGAHLLTVKERLGHSTIQITADRYGHLFPSLEEDLTARLGRSYQDAVVIDLD
jgi:integrase